MKISNIKYRQRGEIKCHQRNMDISVELGVELKKV